MGWHFVRTHWGRGSATEAASRVMEHGFDDLELDPLIADIAVHNERSEALARRLGMSPRLDPIERSGIEHLVWERSASR